MGSSLTLQALQRGFIDHLLNPTQNPPLFHSLCSSRLSIKECVFIYRNNMKAGLKKALEDAYPVCQRLVGEQCFGIMASQYIAQHPSEAFSLYDYGDKFPEFILKCDALSNLPYLFDVATLEWAIHAIILGSEVKIFDWDALASVPIAEQEHIIFHRRENSVLFHSLFPIDRIWETNQPDFEGDDRVDLWEGEVFLFLWRKGYDLKIDRLTEAEWQLLDLLNGTKELGQLPEAMIAKEYHLETPQLLPKLIKAGFISSFKVTER